MNKLINAYKILLGPLHCSYLGQAKSIVICYLTMAEKVVEKRSCYSEETPKEAVRLVNVEGFSFGEAQLATGIQEKEGGNRQKNPEETGFK